MKSFIIYLFSEAPKELKVIIASGAFGSIWSKLFVMMADDAMNKFLSSLVSVGSLITMGLACIFWVIKIRRAKNEGN